MLSNYDKAIAALLPGIVIWANQKWGLAIPADPATVAIFAGVITSTLVYFIPNKEA